MYVQVSEYTGHLLSYYIFGQRKWHSTHQCVLVMIEMLKNLLDEQKMAGTVLTDSSKAFECLPHDPLIAKLYVYCLWVYGFKK